MNIIKNISSFILFVLFIVAISWTGCIERTIDGFEENAGLYSMYGAFNADINWNIVRIKNTRLPSIPDSLIPFDATVTFEDVEDGTITTLDHYTINISGYYVHNFVVEQSLVPNKTYQLKVTRPDIKTVKSTVTIPAITEVLVNPSDNIHCEQQIEFTFKNVNYPEHLRMEVGFGGRWSEIGQVAQLEHKIDENEMFVRMSPRNLLAEVFPPDPRVRPSNPREWVPVEYGCYSFDFFNVRYTHYGREWDIFSPGFFPIDPLQWQDVEHGLGFLGAFRRGTFSIPI